MLDILGDFYGSWYVESEAPPRYARSGRGYRRFNCICVCGTRRVVEMAALRNGRSTSCGCYKLELFAERQEEMRQKRKYTRRDYSGTPIGKITILGDAPDKEYLCGQKSRQVYIQCEHGLTHVRHLGNVLRGKYKRCNCK